jgi:hypothetical protein
MIIIMNPINKGFPIQQTSCLLINISFFYSRSSQRSRYDTSSRTSRNSQQSRRHSHSRDTTNETSLNETNFDIKNKKRKQHYTDNSNYSPKRHRHSSPLPSYPMSVYPSHHYQQQQHHRRSKYHRRSSSSSTHTSEHSSSNENDNNNQHQRSTKGTLASELDKLRPKINKNKTVTTNNQSQNEQETKLHNDVSIRQSYSSNQ